MVLGRALRALALHETRFGRSGYLLLAVSLTAWLATRFTVSWPGFYDLTVYRAEGLAVRDGGQLYGHLSDTSSLATYPPFAALLFVALSGPAVPVLHGLVLFGNLVLLVVVCDLACRLVGVPARSHRPVACALAAVALWCEPVYVAMNYGQIDLVLLGLVLADFTVWRRTPAFGVALGLATAIKVTPGLFVVYLLLTRRWRAAGVAAGTFAATVAVSVAVDPAGTWRFWTDYLFQLRRVGRIENYANQSVHGLVARSFGVVEVPGAVSAVIGAAMVAGVLFAARVHTRLGDGVAVPVCAVVGLLCAPIAWSHHWVWCIAVIAVVGVRFPAWTPVLAVFWTFATWLLPGRQELRADAGEVLVSSGYVAVGVLFLVLVGRELRRGTRWQRELTARRALRPAVRPTPPAAAGRARPGRVTPPA